MCFLSVDDPTSDDHFHGPSKPDDSRETLSSPIRQTNIPAPASYAKRCVLFRNSDIRKARPFKAAGIGYTVHRRDDRLVDIGRCNGPMTACRSSRNESFRSTARGPSSRSSSCSTVVRGRRSRVVLTSRPFFQRKTHSRNFWAPVQAHAELLLAFCASIGFKPGDFMTTGMNEADCVAL